MSNISVTAYKAGIKDGLTSAADKSKAMDVLNDYVKAAERHVPMLRKSFLALKKAFDAKDWDTFNEALHRLGLYLKSNLKDFSYNTFMYEIVKAIETLYDGEKIYDVTNQLGLPNSTIYDLSEIAVIYGDMASTERWSSIEEYLASLGRSIRNLPQMRKDVLKIAKGAFDKTHAKSHHKKVNAPARQLKAAVYVKGFQDAVKGGFDKGHAIDLIRDYVDMAEGQLPMLKKQWLALKKAFDTKDWDGMTTLLDQLGEYIESNFSIFSKRHFSRVLAAIETLYDVDAIIDVEKEIGQSFWIISNLPELAILYYDRPAVLPQYHSFLKKFAEIIRAIPKIRKEMNTVIDGGIRKMSTGNKK